MILFKNQTLRYRNESGSKAVEKAIADLSDDLRDVMNITLVESDGDADFIFGAEPPEAVKGIDEGHAIIVKDGHAEFSGTDERGIMWAIYTFSDEYLGVFPLWFWADQKKPRLNKLTMRDYISAPFRFRYRGWFLNDEDLLTGFIKTAGRRDVDYPYYHTVVSPDLIDKAAEAALRSKLNLIIPASLMNIDNPDERVLVDVCAERGLYITQHHIEPLGVSSFTWDNYWSKRGGEIPVQSYIQSPEEYEEIWRYYAKLWAKYPNVIWQFGLRGRGDAPVWQLDPNVPEDSKGRGALITKAIMTQYDIVKETLGHENFVSTSTLWMEGGALMESGCLNFPESTIIVYSDNGYTQCFGSDLELCENDRLKGIYYHAAFINGGPHLARGNPPAHMQKNILRALSKGCDRYAILNVSNIREFVENLNFFTALSREGERLDRKKTMKIYSDRVFGSAAYAELCESFYDVYERLPGDSYFIDGHIMIAGENAIFYLAQNETSKCPPDPFGVMHGKDRSLTFESYKKLMEHEISKIKVFLEKKKELPAEEYLNFFRSQFEHQPKIVLQLCEWAYEIFSFALDRDKAHLTNALDRLDDLRGALAKNAYRNSAPLCDWSGWYNECLKISPDKMEAQTRSLL